mmetsp:Transcript_34267/g.91829  ORF Transcript_34267/g.91829 Transcript_34267/m.91829 type:complete len:224 (+) Transcript_34267:593-1264(+)
MHRHDDRVGGLSGLHVWRLHRQRLVHLRRRLRVELGSFEVFGHLRRLCDRWAVCRRGLLRLRGGRRGRLREWVRNLRRWLGRLRHIPTWGSEPRVLRRRLRRQPGGARHAHVPALWRVPAGVRVQRGGRGGQGGVHLCGRLFRRAEHILRVLRRCGLHRWRDVLRVRGRTEGGVGAVGGAWRREPGPAGPRRAELGERARCRLVRGRRRDPGAGRGRRCGGPR